MRKVIGAFVLLVVIVILAVGAMGKSGGEGKPSMGLIPFDGPDPSCFVVAGVTPDRDGRWFSRVHLDELEWEDVVIRPLDRHEYNHPFTGTIARGDVVCGLPAAFDLYYPEEEWVMDTWEGSAGQRSTYSASS